MFLFVDSNFRNALSYGGRQLGSVFSEAVQRNARRCPDRASTIHQINTCMRTLVSGQRAALVFGGFENFATGTRSIIQSDPMSELKSELASYVKMVRDILVLYPLVITYIIPPIYRSQPPWYSESYAALLPLFLSEVSHVDATRVMVIPAFHVSAEDLDCEGVHFGPPALQRFLDQLLRSFTDGVFVVPGEHPILAPDDESLDMDNDAPGEFLFCFLNLPPVTILFSIIYTL